MKKKTKRLLFILGILSFAATAIGLTMSALRQSITYFYLPADINALAQRPAAAIRLGGLVEVGSIAYAQNESSHEVAFSVTDGADSIRVTYSGLLPDLFREGQGVIVEGRFTPDGSILKAANVLAKHDENYMPPEVAAALKKSGAAHPGPKP